MICVVIKGPSFDEANRQISHSLPYADCIELRLDCFNTLDMNALRKLRSYFSIPMIFTLRSVQQGGAYKGSEEERLADICRLVALEPEYFDLENHVSAHFIADISLNYPKIKLILSYHHFMAVPEDLEKLYDDMRKVPASLYKVAVTPCNCLDVVRFMLWVKKNSGNLIAIGMGIHGQISRVLVPILGCPFVYASFEEDENALGQLSAKTLIHTYHYRNLNPQTAVYALIGDPVDRSMSHETHTELMSACGLNAVYVKIQVTSLELDAFLQLAKCLPICGISVTMPLKEHIIPFLDEIDVQAMNIGAVNTVLLREGKWCGFNTDGIGALNALESECRVKDKRIVIIGAGGAAKAVVYEAIRRGAIVTVINRDETKALEIAKKYGCEGSGLECMTNGISVDYDILINCTPVDCPIALESIIPGTTVMDIKTRARDTAFLKYAKQKKCRIIYGSRMFTEQAIGQFALWFKDRVDDQTCRAILENKLEECIFAYKK